MGKHDQVKNTAAATLTAGPEAFSASGAIPGGVHSRQQRSLLEHSDAGTRFCISWRDTSSNTEPAVKCWHCWGKQGGDSPVTAELCPSKQGTSSALPAPAEGAVAKGKMNLRRSAPPAVRFVPKPTFWSSHTPLLGIKSPPDIYMGKLSMCCIACTKEEQDVLKGSVWETGDLRISAPQQGKPLVSCVWCFTPGDKLRRTWQLLVLSLGQNSLLLPRPSSDRVLQHLGGERGGCSASLLPATAAVDRSCCTRVSRIRASTHSFSKSSSSRISIWRVAVTDGHEGPSALTASTTKKNSFGKVQNHFHLSAVLRGAIAREAPKEGSGFAALPCCLKWCTSCHRPPTPVTDTASQLTLCVGTAAALPAQHVLQRSSFRNKTVFKNT